MIVLNPDETMYENRNTELLIQDVYRFDPGTKFSIVGDMITEYEALALYHAVSSNGSIKKT